MKSIADISKRIFNKESLCGVLLIFVSTWLLLSIEVEIPIRRASNINSRTIPSVALWILFVCGTVLVLQGVFSKKSIPILFNKAQMKSLGGYIFYLLCFAIYPLLLSAVGYVFATLALSLVILLNYKTRTIHHYIITLGIVLIVYYSFKFLLYVNLPNFF